MPIYVFLAETGRDRTMLTENAEGEMAVLGEGTAPTVQGSWEDQLEMIPLQKEPEEAFSEQK